MDEVRVAESGAETVVVGASATGELLDSQCAGSSIVVTPPRTSPPTREEAKAISFFFHCEDAIATMFFYDIVLAHHLSMQQKSQY